jgi:hypothetical protein
MRQLSGDDISTTAKQGGFHGTQISQRVHGHEFARLLAKIALGCAVDCLGITPVETPLGGVVVYSQDDVGQWVGQPVPGLPKLIKQYDIGNGLHTIKLYGGREIWAILRLFAKKNETMDYLAVVRPSRRPIAHRLLSRLSAYRQTRFSPMPRQHSVAISSRQP